MNNGSRFSLSSALFFLIFSVVTCVPLSAHAGIVTTSEIVNARQIENTRAHLSALLAREDVRKALAASGVDVNAAQQRVASMTDLEVQQLAANIDQLPVGGRLTNLETVLLVLLIVLLI